MKIDVGCSFQSSGPCFEAKLKKSVMIRLELNEMNGYPIKNKHQKKAFNRASEPIEDLALVPDPRTDWTLPPTLNLEP